MCEYCGCQDIAAIAELTREHDAVVAEISRVRGCVRDDDVAGAAEAARRISRVLAPHTAVEEHGLFPHLAHEFPDHVAVLEREHREIEAVLVQAADGTPRDPGWPAQLLAAMERLRDHILKEQDGLFPASLSILDQDAWASVDAARVAAGSALPAPDHPEDPGHHHDDPEHEHDQDHSHPPVHQHA
ncbi:hemerythrin domain-containing protein [Phycicoccus ginsengisoli]